MVNKIDPLLMLKMFARDITDLIEKKIEALKKIGDLAEESSLDYFKDGSIKDDSHEPVSSVHFPKEIVHSLEITDTLNWTRSLDRVFSDNKKADPSLFGQFFASPAGFMRHFPAMDEKELKIDPRHRDWYTGAVAGPRVSSTIPISIII